MILKTVRYPFYVSIAALIVAIIFILTGLFMFISHRESRAAAIHMADRLFSEINTKTMERYASTLESVAMVAGLAARMPGMSTVPKGEGLFHPGVEFMLAALDYHRDIFSVYTGYRDGSFIQIVSLRNRSAMGRLFEAPLGTAYVLRTVSVDGKGQLEQRWRFLNNDKKIIGEGPHMDPGYDPRIRPWYLQAQQEQTAFYTAPYIFSSTKLPGITCAEKLISGAGVFGIDITLDHFSRSLERQRVSDNGTLFLFDRAGRIIAHPSEDPRRAGKEETLDFISAKDFGDPLIQAVVAAYQHNPEGMLNRTREIQIEGNTYLVRWTGLKDTLKFDQILASIAPVSDFTGHIRYMQRRVFLFSSIVLVLVMLLGLLISRKIT
ncbi:MAG: cache domain-containing protein [Deltaproteobacteria bacterium]